MEAMEAMRNDSRIRMEMMRVWEAPKNRYRVNSFWRWKKR